MEVVPLALRQSLDNSRTFTSTTVGHLKSGLSFLFFFPAVWKCKDVKAAEYPISLMYIDDGSNFSE